MRPNVVIIILNWNGFQDTKECLDSLFKINYGNYRIYLVDNGSTDGSLEKLNSEFGKNKNLVILPTGKNLGFAGGNNFALRKALEDKEQKYDYFLLLNNDTIVETDFLSELVLAAEADEKIGIVAPVIYFYPHTLNRVVGMDDDRKKIYSEAMNSQDNAQKDMGVYPEKNDDKIIWFGGGKMNWLKNKGEHLFYKKSGLDIPHKSIITSVFVTGCAMLIKKRVIRSIGLMDEDYFLYYEDAAYNLKAKEAGFCSVVATRSHIYHKVSRATKEYSFSYIYYHTRNGAMMARDHGTHISRIVLHFANFYIILKQCVKLFFPSKKMWAKAVLLGLFDFYRGKRGQFQADEILISKS